MSDWDNMKVADAIRLVQRLLDDLEHEHDPMPGVCPVCQCRNAMKVVAKADRMYRSEKSMVTNRVRRENDELKMRLHITTELLEGKTPKV